jgi:hypothetical protein
MPKKPERFGIKVWALCEAASAYTLQFQVYTGKTDGEIEHGLAYRVVCELAQGYLNKDYRLYFDNFYTTVELMRHLSTQKTYACGTIRSNRKMLPPDIMKEKMKKGEAKFWKWNDLTAVRWKDKSQQFIAMKW